MTNPLNFVPRIELSDADHQEILAAAERRFPQESYDQLIATGLTDLEARELLGFPTQPSELTD